jgi:tetratricopeptide (TPR) repeat protein
MMSRRAAWLFPALGVAFSILLPRPSRAQDDATIEMARQRFREGVQYYDQKQFEKARLAFLQAYALKPHPSVLLNLAQSELRSGHPDEAAGHFSQYLRVNTTASDAERQETTAGYNTAKSRVGEITLTVDPAGAQVLVDGVDKGIAPLPDPLYVLPGSHTIEARASDRHASKSVTLSAGQSVSVQLAARGSIAAAGAPAVAETAPPTEGEPAEEGPPPEQKQLEQSNVLDEKAETPPASTGKHEDLVAWFASTPPAWVLAGAGVVGLGVGVTMAFVASHNYSNAENVADTIIAEWTQGSPSDQMQVGSGTPCSLPDNATAVLGAARVTQYDEACSLYTSRSNSGDSAKMVAIVSSAIGGAALLGTVVYYFLDRDTEKAGSAKADGVRIQVTPLVTGTQGGIGVFGRF